MPKNILLNYTKTYIDSVTKKIINILKSKRFKFETEDDFGTPRIKNSNFCRKYDLQEDETVELIIKSLTSECFCDVKIDNSKYENRRGKEMFIYLLTLMLTEDGANYKPVNVYLKLEMVQITGNKKIVLIISIHEPEYEMKKKYDSLPMSKKR